MTKDLSRRGEAEPIGDELSWSTIYRVLSHTDRCALLNALSRSEEPLTLNEAAEEVVRLNSDTPKDEITPDRVEQCSISLHHRHVPILTERGIVTVGEHELLSLTEKGEQIVEAKEQIDQQNSDFS